MFAVRERYVVDNRGNKRAIILPIARYRALLEEMHDLAVVAERRREAPVSGEEMKRRLKKRGLL